MQPEQRRSVAPFRNSPHSPRDSTKLKCRIPENDRCDLIGHHRQCRNLVFISSTGMTCSQLLRLQKNSADLFQRATLLTMRLDSNVSQSGCGRNWPPPHVREPPSGRKCTPDPQTADFSEFSFPSAADFAAAQHTPRESRATTANHSQRDCRRKALAAEFAAVTALRPAGRFRDVRPAH